MREDGFTLLELLIAITLLSLVALVMTGGLKIGARAWHTAENTSDAAEMTTAAQHVLRHQLGAIYPLWQEGANGNGAVVFAGESQRLAYVAQPPAPIGPGPNRSYELALANGDLILSWSSPDSAASVQPVRTTLLRHVQSLDLAYYGPPPASDISNWSGNWTERARLPQLIRIRVMFAAGDKRVWPDLVVHPAIAADVTCIYDPISQDCRGREQ